MTKIRETSTQRRERRVRHKLKTMHPGGIRLSVYRSSMNIYAQVIDDTKGVTVVSASTVEKKLVKEAAKLSAMQAAELVGKTVAERAVAAGVSTVYFDRGSFRFTGRVKSLADAARSAGLKF